MGDFFDLGFDSALNFDWAMPSVEQYQEPSQFFQGYQEQPLTFDFQPSAFELQGGAWDANSWLRDTAAQAPAYSLGGAGGGQGAAISHYDPSTKTYFDTSGNPVQPQGGGPVGGPMTPGGQIGSSGQPGPYPNAGLVAEPPGTPGPQGQPQGQPGAGSWMDSINSFLKSPLGGLLGAGGVGAAGLGVGKLLAGPTPKTPTPSLTPGNPINAAGQNQMAQFYADQAGREAGYQAEQAPGYQGIRNQAMTLIPGQLNPVNVDQYQDPVQQAMQAELMSTLQGGASPLVEEQIRKDWATLQNTMYRQLGNNPDWMLSSPGQEAINSFNRNAAIARDQSKNAKVAAYSPLESGRAQFSYTAPVEKARALGGEQRAYVDTLSRASALGRMDPAALQAGLGGNPDQYRGMMTTLGSNSQMAGYNQANQERAQTMAGVGGIAGTVAGQMGNLGQSDRIAKAIRESYGQNPAVPSGYYGAR